MIYIILSRLWHDNDVLRFLAINLVGLLTSNMLQNISLLVSIAATIITCSLGAALVIYKIRLIKKELKQ